MKCKPKTDRIAMIIRKKRKELSWSQDAVAYAMGISQNAYSKIELGYTTISLLQYLHLCEILDIDSCSALSEAYAA